MMVDQRLYEKGEFVSMVDLSELGPLQVPIPLRWYALKVHPNREAKVMRTFRQRNISAYLPMETKSQTITRHRRGYSFEVKRDVTSPLFPGIIFIPDFQAKLGGVLEVEGVDQYFRMGDCVPFLNAQQIAQVRTLEALGNMPVSRKKRLWLAGDLVRVTDGPFRSFGGMIQRGLDSKGRLTVLVEIFQRLSPIELEEGQIEAV